MGTTIKVSHYLSNAQVETLINAGLVNKVNWWMKNLTTNSWVNYAQLNGGEKIKGNVQFNVTFPEDFPVGTELQVGVGDYNTKDDKGWGCSQKECFYVSENGVIPCKYRELPSQNNGVVPQLPEPEQSKITAQVPQAISESYAPPVAEQTPSPVLSSSEKNGKIKYMLIPQNVWCRQSFDMMGAEDYCSLFAPASDDTQDRICMCCKHHKEIYIEGD